MYIVKYFNSEQNMDIECFALCSDKMIEALENKKYKLKQEIYVCGTKFGDFKKFYDSLFIKKLNDNETEVVMNLFGTEFGSFNLQIELNKVLEDKAFENPLKINDGIDGISKYVDYKSKYYKSWSKDEYRWTFDWKQKDSK